MSLTFDQPVLLGLLVPALAIVFLLWRTSRAYLPPLRRWASLIVRSLVVSLLLVALAGPHLTRSADTLAVAVLLDRSDSISPADQDREQQWLSHLLASKRPDDQVAVVSFAGQAEVDRPLSADPSMPTFGDTTSLHPSRTNIASAIRLGLAALPPSAARRLVLLSDGNENDEQATSAAALAAAAGVPIDTVALPGPAGPSAVVEALDAPSHVRQTDQFAVTVQVRATQAMPATLYLAENDHLLAQQAV